VKVNNIFFALLLIIFVGGACAPEPVIHKKKFAGVNLTAHTVKTAVNGAASYQEVNALLQRLSAELMTLEDKDSTPREKDLLRHYAELLAIYQDGLLLWKYKLEFTPFAFVPKGRIYVRQDVEPIVSKYQLATQSHVYQQTGQTWKSISEDSIKIIWSNADSQLKIIDAVTDSEGT